MRSNNRPSACETETKHTGTHYAWAHTTHGHTLHTGTHYTRAHTTHGHTLRMGAHAKAPTKKKLKLKRNQMVLHQWRCWVMGYCVNGGVPSWGVASCVTHEVLRHPGGASRASDVERSPGRVDHRVPAVCRVPCAVSVRVSPCRV
jgi:hypothetical protein